MMSVTSRRAFGVLLLAPLVVAACGAPTDEAPPDLAVVNARVWTGDDSAPWAEGIAVRGDRITTVGDLAAIEGLGASRVVDAAGGMVVPGFIDSHVHFVDGGFRLSSVQLRDAATPEEFSARIGAFAATVPPGTWITGGDWDHERWGGELPVRAWIDELTPDHPVWVNRLDGHMALANSVALAAAGVDAGTEDIEGGEIVRRADGAPTGVLKDNAMALVDRVVPEPPDALEDRALDAAMRYVAEQGVTSVHAMGSWDDLETYGRAQDRGRLSTRIYAAVPLEMWEQLRDTIAARTYGGDGHGDAWLQIGMLKGFMDGSLGSHTAAFFDDFTDSPGDRGFFLSPPEEIERLVSMADAAALQVAIHAIGDRANRTLLDIYERVAIDHGERDRRFRVEHAQHLAPEDIPRFAALGVIPSMQPYHAIDDGRWAERVIGPERALGTYAFRSLFESGARVAFGSDWFVAPPTPLEGIYAALTRRTLDDAHPDGWVPGETIGVEEALRAYTVNAAYASFQEASKGRLEPGMLADFAVLDRDLTSIPATEIRDVRVMMTVVGGRPVFER